MTVQINCDRCGKDTRLFYLNAEVKLMRGMFANVNSKVSPSRLPWGHDWHLCEQCGGDLQRWSNPPEVAE